MSETKSRKVHNRDAGYVAERMNPFVPGTKVVIYVASEQDIDVGTNKYAVVCDAHATICGENSIPRARKLMKLPEFCEECQKISEARVPTETKATHTPGPWEANESSRRIEQSHWIIAHDSHDIPLATISENLSRPEVADANARLIANAPELLEALRFFVDSRSAGGGYARYEAAEEMARAAIAKATKQNE